MKHLRSEFLSVLKRARRRSRCLVEKCPSRPIRCHSISLSNAIRPLARDGKIYRLDAHPVVLRERGGVPEVVLDGIRRASTFYGFCADHDRRLFRPIDESLFVFDRHQAALLLVRALAHEISKKEMAMAVARFLRNSVGDEAWARDLEIGTQWSHASLQRNLDLVQTALIERSLERLHFNAFVSHADPPLVSSIVWFPDFGFDGERIQHVPQVQHEPGLIGIFSQPHVEGSVCVIVWNDDSDWCARRLFASIARTRPNSEIGDAFLQLQMTIAENVYFTPRWWDSVSESAKSKYFAWWRRQIDVTIAPDPKYAEQLRDPAFSWPTEYVRTG